MIPCYNYNKHKAKFFLNHRNRTNGTNAEPVKSMHFHFSTTGDGIFKCVIIITTINRWAGVGFGWIIFRRGVMGMAWSMGGEFKCVIIITRIKKGKKVWNGGLVFGAGGDRKK